MTQSARRAVAMTLVATALCADFALASPQAVRPEAVQAKSTLVGRLTVSLRRCVAAVRLVEMRRDQDRCVPGALPAVPQRILALQAYSPFEFRLPPPVR